MDRKAASFARKPAVYRTGGGRKKSAGIMSLAEGTLNILNTKMCSGEAPRLEKKSSIKSSVRKGSVRKLQLEKKHSIRRPSGSKLNESSEDDLDPKDIERALSTSMSVASFHRMHSRRQNTIAAVFPPGDGPQTALKELQNVCDEMNVLLLELEFQRLDFGELDVLENFYSADVAISDFTTLTYQPSLFYHLGVRVSCGMKDNVVLCLDESEEKTRTVKVNLSICVKKEGNRLKVVANYCCSVKGSYRTKQY